jgi:hypothetical protein
MHTRAVFKQQLNQPQVQIGPIDIADAVGLMKVAKITTKEALVALMKECYPGIPGLVDPLAPRMKAKIYTLVDAYANATEEPDPTWNAGTGPATRKI